MARAGKEWEEELKKICGECIDKTILAERALKAARKYGEGHQNLIEDAYTNLREALKKLRKVPYINRDFPNDVLE